MASGTIHNNNWKLVWTNPSPTSSFAEQTVSLDLSNYQEIQIFYQYSTTDTDKVTSIQMINGGNIVSMFFQGFPNSGTLGARRRYAEATDSGIVFSDAYSKSGTSAATKENNGMIPAYIYAR